MAKQNQYGPWATSIGAFGNPQLSAFWRKRLTKLTPTSQSSPTLSRRSLLCLGAAGVLTGALPTFRLVLADEKEPTDTAEKASSGSIYVSAVWTVGDPGPLAQGGIIDIDPKTGHWEKVAEGCDVVRVSPDGKRIALRKGLRMSDDTSGTPIDIFVRDLETGEETRMSDDAGIVSWSPDGKELVVSQRKSGTWRVTNEGSRRLPIPETDEVHDWSRDGKWFATQSNRNWAPPLGWQIYRMRPDGTEQRQLTHEGRNLSPRFSPDSRQILYQRDYWLSKRDVDELHIMDVDGANDHVILRNEALARFEEACWSPDGRRVAVIWTTWEMQNGEKVRWQGKAANYRIEVMDADGKNRRLLNLGDATILQLRKLDWR